MNLRLSRNNFMAGLFIVISVLFVLTDAFQLHSGIGTRIILVGLVWMLIHFMSAYKEKARAGWLLLFCVTGLACLDIAFFRWVDYVRYYHPLRIGMSQVFSKVLFIEKWPDFIFYSMNAASDGVGPGDPNYIFEIILMTILAYVVGTSIYNGIKVGRHYGYFLIPVILFIQQWFQYAENIHVQFSLYFIGFIMIAGNQTRQSVFKEAPNSAFGLKHFKAKRYGSYLFLFGLIVILLSNVAMFFVPVDGINVAIGELVPNVHDMRTGYKRQSMAMFTFKQTMYQPYGERLGGPVDRGENPVLLRVWSDRAGVYLRGRVKTKYTGSFWVSEHVSYKNRNDHSSVTGVPKTKERSYEVTIVPEGISTKTLFAPLGVKETFLSSEKVFLNPDGAMYYKRESLEGPLDIYTLRGVDYSMNIEDNDIYLELPVNFDEAVTLKAQELTEELESDYEKMNALKSWLRETYPYDLSPALPPSDVDFVSYFLYEEQSGYCTYFASALATMGRAVDIPTRYVEGFLLPGSREPDGSFAVRADRAHAWAEAYIEGEGWRIFEATPAYSGSTGRMDSNRDVLDSKSSESTLGDESAFTLDAKEALLDVEIGDSAAYTPDETDVYSEVLIYVALGLVVISILVALTVLQLVGRFFKRGTKSQQAVRWIYYMEDLIDDDSATFTPAEKLKRYVVESGEREKGLLPQAYGIIDTINTTLYSGVDVSEESLSQILSVVLQIEKSTKGRMNRLKYWMEYRRSRK